MAPKSLSHFPRLSHEDRCCPLENPPLGLSNLFVENHLPLHLSVEYRMLQVDVSYGKFSQEKIAFAVGKLTAAQILPALTDMRDGCELLDFSIHLRHYMSGDLVDELAAVLDTRGESLYWNRVDQNGYACVIGSGVAAFIDTTRDAETLHLRYANGLIHELYRAHRAAEMPRSLLFLQTALYERIDALLADVRTCIWHWLT